MNRFKCFVIGLFIVLVLTIMLLQIYKNSKSYPSIDNLLRKDGMIHHPTYGKYPEEVNYEQGMTLHPGQSATVILDFLPDDFFVLDEEEK